MRLRSRASKHQNSASSVLALTLFSKCLSALCEGCLSPLGSKSRDIILLVYSTHEAALSLLNPLLRAIKSISLEYNPHVSMKDKRPSSWDRSGVSSTLIQDPRPLKHPEKNSAHSRTAHLRILRGWPLRYGTKGSDTPPILALQFSLV